MDWWWKAALTTAVMWGLMAAGRRGGRRLAGVLAGLPTITGPTLAWTALEQGPGFAVDAAVGSVAACAVLAMFALAYVQASRRCGAWGALACGLLAAALALLPAHLASQALGPALLLALAAGALAGAALPVRVAGVAGVAGAGPRAAAPPPWLAAVAVGALTALTAQLAPLLGAFGTGVLASLPLVSAALAMAEQRSAGHPASTEFLRGYVRGLFGKAAFGALFAVLALPAGVGLALLLASGCACVLGLLRPRLHFPAR